MDLDELKKLHQAHVAELSASYGAALEAGGFGAIVIHSGHAARRSRFDDQYWPFRPTPFFQHWLPLAEADAALIIKPGAKPTLLRSKLLNYWEQPAPPETDHFWDQFEIIDLARPDEVRYHLGGRVAFIGEDPATAEQWGLSADLANWEPLLTTLDQLRVTKTPYEIYCLAEANRRAAEGHNEVKKAFFEGDQAELDLHLLYLNRTRQYDGETPYQNIVALDVHAATLHHVSYAKKATPAQTLLLDAGATFAGYCSDVTRTYVKGNSGEAQAFKQLIDGVESLQQRSCTQAQLYKPYEELHEEAHSAVAGVLRELGVSRLSTEELVSTGITRTFFPHGLGHALGLQCHDVGCAVIKPKPENPHLRNTTIIAPGQCFTIEPGIYFIQGLLQPLREGKQSGGIDWGVVDKLAPLGGVRIEDDVIVGKEGEGLRNLTREVLP